MKNIIALVFIASIMTAGVMAWASFDSAIKAQEKAQSAQAFEIEQILAGK